MKTLVNRSGETSSGDSFFITLMVPANGLAPGNSIPSAMLQFRILDRINFAFTISLNTCALVPDPLPPDATGPVVESNPPAIAMVNEPLRYQVVASSAHPGTLRYSLSRAPTGMTIDGNSGLLRWTPSAPQVGDQSIALVVRDSGGQATQSFTLSTFGSTPLKTVTIHAAEGGFIQINDPNSTINGLTIAIPAGALANDTTLTVSELIAPPTIGGLARFLLKGFSTQPDDMQLSIPATITMPYSPTEFSGNTGVHLQSLLGAYFLQTSTGNPQWLPSVAANQGLQNIGGTVSHLSGFAFTNGAALCAPVQILATVPRHLIVPLLLGFPLLRFGLLRRCSYMGFSEAAKHLGSYRLSF